MAIPKVLPSLLHSGMTPVSQYVYVSYLTFIHSQIREKKREEIESDGYSVQQQVEG